MTIIHVTIPDHTEALGVVATLLKQGYHIAIDLDAVPTEPVVAPPWVTAEITRREWVEALQTVNTSVYGARVGFDGSDYSINGRKVSENEFNQEMAERSMARYERAMESERAINEVACPLCKQERGERCITAAGSLYSWHKVHKPRWHEYVMRGDDVTPAR